MAPIIKWPRVDRPILIPNPKKFFIASGRVYPGIIGVFGQIQSLTNANIVYEGTPVAFYWGKRRSLAEQPFYRWQIYFLLSPDPDDYKLTVTGLTKVGESLTSTRDFRTRGAFETTILSHGANDNITNEKDDFVAYGSLINYPLGDVTMTNTDSTEIYPTHTFGDSVDLQFWSAQFPVLGPDTYVLRAEDNVTNASTVSGLTVDG